MYRVYLFVIGICICCPLIGAKEPLHLLADPTPTVTLDMKRVSLQDILLEIEKQTGLFFSYESSMLKEFRHVSLTARDESLSYCLKRLFEPLPLVYRITGRYVILKRKPRQYTISGFVRDSASYESLIAATVVERSSGKDRFPIITAFTVLRYLRGKWCCLLLMSATSPVPLRSS